MVKKVEIVLFAIAILLCGVTFAVAVERDNSPIEISVSMPLLIKEINDEFISEAMIEKTDDKVNINTANEYELQSLDGIGKVKAKNIVEYRKNYKFSVKEELMNVSCIGEKTFQKIKNHITVD